MRLLQRLNIRHPRNPSRILRLLGRPSTVSTGFLGSDHIEAWGSFAAADHAHGVSVAGAVPAAFEEAGHGWHAAADHTDVDLDQRPEAGGCEVPTMMGD